MTNTTCDRRGADLGREIPCLGLIDDYLLRRITFKARRLAIKLQLEEDGRDDLVQAMAVELLKAAGRFDPNGSASWHTYANRVLDIAAMKLADREYRRQQHSSEEAPRLREPSDGGDEMARLELRLDVETVLSRMPEPMRRVCGLLMVMAPNQVARVVGLHHDTIRRLIAQAKTRFIDSAFDFSDFSRGIRGPHVGVEDEYRPAPGRTVAGPSRRRPPPGRILGSTGQPGPNRRPMAGMRPKPPISTPRSHYMVRNAQGDRLCR